MLQPMESNIRFDAVKRSVVKMAAPVVLHLSFRRSYRHLKYSFWYLTNNDSLPGDRYIAQQW